VVRSFIIFPLRLICLLGGLLIFAVSFACIKASPSQCLAAERRASLERKLIRFLCSVFVFSWCGVIRYHGVIPTRRTGQIYVANHSSMIDAIILSQMNTFSLIGQLHTGWLRYAQTKVLACLNCIWFQRSDSKDREKAAAMIRAHIADKDSNRLLIFPEGTCVNNEYVVQFKRGVAIFLSYFHAVPSCSLEARIRMSYVRFITFISFISSRYVVQFKRGAFAMGATICPIAIKYNKIFVDGYWNSRAIGFGGHLMRLMRSWAVVCDVWYLPPMRMRDVETDIQFAGRVQRKIAACARLTAVEWDGYMKYYAPSLRFVNQVGSLASVHHYTFFNSLNGFLCSLPGRCNLHVVSVYHCIPLPLFLNTHALSRPSFLPSFLSYPAAQAVCRQYAAIARRIIVFDVDVDVDGGVACAQER
jgi:glycerol-3-phosphate O-acyltransferase 3/4